MRYKITYICAFGLMLGYLLTQTMQTPPSAPPPSAPPPSREPSPLQPIFAEESKPATPVQEKTTLEKIEKFFKRIETSTSYTERNLKIFQNLCVKGLKILNNRFSNKEVWTQPLSNFKDENIFYVQKLTVNPNDLIFIFGDLHGDSSALLNALEKLVEEGVLNDQWELEEHNYLVFLGDYTDRGHYGVEVWYILLQLLEANPDPSQIIMLRGNHESFDMNYSFGESINQNGYVNELRKKFALSPYEHSPNIYHLFTNLLYNKLPVALYISCNNTTILCAHGGLDLGFNPQPLLSRVDSPVLFMPFTNITRRSEFKNLPLPTQEALQKTLKPKDIQNIESLTPSDLHFLWSDFSDNPETISSPRGAGWALGYNLTKALLERDNIQCMFRGHQHSSPYLETLEINKGFFSFEHSPIHTLISFSKIQSLPIICEHYSFIKLEMGTTFDLWKAWHIRDEENISIDLTRKTPPTSPTPRLKRPDMSYPATLDDLRAPDEDISVFSEQTDQPTKKLRPQINLLKEQSEEEPNT